MKNKVLAFIIAAIFAIACIPYTVVIAEPASGAADILSVEFEKDGSFEIVGQIEGAEVGTQVSFVLADADMFDSAGHIIESEFNMENLAYIDQVSTGNNGVFLIQGAVGTEWANREVRFAGNSSYGNNYYTQQLAIPEVYPGLEIIQSNSVLYGRDVFYINGIFYKPDAVAEAMAFGGNNIYFILGDKWYDLMDVNATDNSYLVESNAATVKEVEALMPRYYYSSAERFELKY